MLTFHLVTLFPEFFTSPLSCGLFARAREAKIVDFAMYNPRDWSCDKHHHVDDAPYGGGPGMVMQVPPVAACLSSIPEPGRMLICTPGGKPLTQNYAKELAKETNITLLCPRYEGIDARIEELFPLEPISIGDVVLNSGDCAALTVIEAVSRLLPGFMGKAGSAWEESFSDNLLEYPHYTRPELVCGLSVPDVLCSGHHAKIAHWRRKMAVTKTRTMRPDLLATAHLDKEDVAFLRQMPQRRLGRNFAFCLVHHPVVIEGKTGTASLTNLDIHDIARISASYGLGDFYVVTPIREQQILLEQICAHWCQGVCAQKHPDRAQALSLVRLAPSIDDVIAQVTETTGVRPKLIASSAKWRDTPLLVPSDIRAMLDQEPVVFCLGTSQGLSSEALALCDGLMRPLRFLDYNHLSVRSAAAIYADRILGDFD
ncbi:MAG: tRNA (guanosine(37)-N1)-methyltransferase TrmD [Desulfovibrio sp.]|nr:tRNA (guanosine(37)-N1)-methyltransferase TrmD [Desulfovibrio sp.]